MHAAAVRCLGHTAECLEYPKIEALYLHEAARMLHLFQRQAEDAAVAAADGAAVPDRLLADIHSRRRERAAQGTEKTDRRSGNRGGDFPIPDP